MCVQFMYISIWNNQSKGNVGLLTHCSVRRILVQLEVLSKIHQSQKDGGCTRFLFRETIFFFQWETLAGILRTLLLLIATAHSFTYNISHSSKVYLRLITRLGTCNIFFIFIIYVSNIYVYRNYKLFIQVLIQLKQKMLLFLITTATILT